MSLPGVFEPSGLPAFLAAGLGIVPDDVYATPERGTGHYRKRRLYTTAPRRVSVSRILTPAQAVAYDDWFESTIVVGETHFTAWIANQGAGQLWYEACWVAPYQAEPFATPQGIFWRMTGDLVLIGDGVVEQPLDGAMAVEYVAHLLGAGAVEASGEMAVEYSANLSPAILLSVEYEADLLQIIRTFRLREAVDYRLREGGGKRFRESNNG